MKLINNVIYGIHTGEMKHRISSKDVTTLKTNFGLKHIHELINRTDLYEKGITEISVESQIKRYMDKNSGTIKETVIYYCCIRINFFRILGLGYFGIMPYTATNIKKVIAKVSTILKDIGLAGENRDFSEWTVIRFDSALEVIEPSQPALLMAEMSRTVNIYASKRKKLMMLTIPGSDSKVVERESLRFGNQSYTWNIYVKATELTKKFADRRAQRIPITPEEIAEAQALKGVIRLERQNHKGAVKVLLPNGKVSDLVLPEVQENVLNAMTDEIAMFFGKNDIKVATDLEAEFGLSEIPGIYGRIVDQTILKKPKRPYHNFPVPCKTKDGRYKANIPLYSCQRIYLNYDRILLERELKKQKSILSEKKLSDPSHEQITGSSIEIYERRVLDKLEYVFERNIMHMNLEDAFVPSYSPSEFRNRDDFNDDYEWEEYERDYQENFEAMIISTYRKSFEAIRNFGELAQTPSIKEEVNRIINKQWKDILPIASIILNLE